MRSCPTTRDLRTNRFGHDVRAKGRLPEHTTRKRETRSDTQKDSAIHVVARFSEASTRTSRVSLKLAGKLCARYGSSCPVGCKWRLLPVRQQRGKAGGR